MGDPYIDYKEVSEYGRYLEARLEQLVGLSRLVDVPELRQRVLAAVEGVEAELKAIRLQQSSVRSGRASTSVAAEEMTGTLRRFHHHIETQPPGTSMDRAAFFPRETSGKLSRLKPADLLARADEVMDGFAVPVNAAMPDAAKWMGEITVKRLALADSLGGKHGARHGRSLATSALSAARERFLHVYNVVAKRLVYVLLADLGRLDEYRQFFLDLQVNEGGRATAPADGDIGDGIDDGIDGDIDDAEPGAPAPAL